MIDIDELEPRKSAAKPLDMQQMSIGELREYIDYLKAEIALAQSAIDKKEAHRSGIENLFKI
ncbi:MAG: DUF1192 domain-containing protein [Alphaproteobacteria bacterium]|nr:DUF1192 domain-containing protein [Alphaproteobacteria bacterium]